VAKLSSSAAASAATSISPGGYRKPVSASKAKAHGGQPARLAWTPANGVSEILMWRKWLAYVGWRIQWLIGSAMAEISAAAHISYNGGVSAGFWRISILAMSLNKLAAKSEMKAFINGIETKEKWRKQQR
jgi:hypothetical protein